jgi:hypothetical protein
MSKQKKNISNIAGLKNGVNSFNKKKAVKSAKKSNRKATNRRYTAGKPTLSIAYNGIGHEFVFSLDQHGKVGTKFHVDTEQILSIMGVPLLVSST